MQHPAEPPWVYQQHLAFALPAAFRMHKATYRKTVSQRYFTDCKSEPEIQTVDREFSLPCCELERHLERPWYPLPQGRCWLMQSPLPGPGVRHQSKQSCAFSCEPLGLSPVLQPSLWLI